MTLEVKHKFTTLKGDGSDLTQVQPSNWNETHSLSMATGKVLGRATAGAGGVEEIDWSAFGRQFINAASASAAQGLLGPVTSIANQAVTYRKLQLASTAARVIASNIIPAKTITGAANNGSGLIRLTMTDTSNFTTGQRKIVSGIVGTVEANDEWVITVVDATHIDLQGSTFANNYVSGGTIGGGYEEHTISDLLDFIGSVVRGDVLARGSAGWVRRAGVQGQVLRSDGTDTAFGNIPLLHVAEIQANNVASTTVFSGASWTLLGLNSSIVNEINSATLAANQVSLPAGTYEAKLIVPSPQTGGSANVFKSRLRNVTDGTTLILSPTFGWNGGGVAGGSPDVIAEGRFTLAATKTIQAQFYQNALTGAGILGGNRSTGYAEQEIYTQLYIRKIG